MGRFLTRDTWEGNYNRPLSLNHWMYVEENPINAIDPSGYITEKESKRANLILEKLNTIYGLHIERDWGWGWYHSYDYNPFNQTPFSTIVISCWVEGNWRNVDELELTLIAAKQMTKTLGGSGKLKSALKGSVNIHRLSPDLIFGSGAYSLNNVMLPNDVFGYGDDWAKGQITHELAHVWDLRSGFQLSQGMKYATKSYTHVCGESDGVVICTDVYDASVAIEQAPTVYAEGNARDDWAESFKIFIYPTLADPGRSLQSIRKGYIEKAIHDIS